MASVDDLKNRCRVDEQTGCWIWQGCTQANGYARVRCHGKTHHAHRLMYRLFHGEPPKGQDVCHRCDRRNCINPKHLFAGTRMDNMRDAQAKGRLSVGERHSARVSAGIRRAKERAWPR